MTLPITITSMRAMARSAISSSSRMAPSSAASASSSISSSTIRRTNIPGSEARKDPQSNYRNWYLWSKKKPPSANKGMVFPGVQKTTWTYDSVAKEYYFHRFYRFQPDLNTSNPLVQAEILKIMGFWIQLGVSGFRMDAVPFVIGTKG